MNITLTPELQHWVQDQVESGSYQSASDVMQEALRLLQEQDEIRQARLEKLRQELQVGIDQLDRGEGIPFSEEFGANIKHLCQANVATGTDSMRSAGFF